MSSTFKEMPVLAIPGDEGRILTVNPDWCDWYESQMGTETGSGFIKGKTIINNVLACQLVVLSKFSVEDREKYLQDTRAVLFPTGSTAFENVVFKTPDPTEQALNNFNTLLEDTDDFISVNASLAANRVWIYAVNRETRVRYVYECTALGNLLQRRIDPNPDVNTNKGADLETRKNPNIEYLTGDDAIANKVIDAVIPHGDSRVNELLGGGIPFNALYAGVKTGEGALHRKEPFDVKSAQTSPAKARSFMSAGKVLEIPEGWNVTPPTPGKGLAQGDTYLATAIDESLGNVVHWVRGPDTKVRVYICTKAGNLLHRVEPGPRYEELPTETGEIGTLADKITMYYSWGPGFKITDDLGGMGVAVSVYPDRVILVNNVGNVDPVPFTGDVPSDWVFERPELLPGFQYVCTSFSEKTRQIFHKLQFDDATFLLYCDTKNKPRSMTKMHGE